MGKAELLPDTDTTWLEQIGRPRPKFLEIFRQFPDNAGEIEPPPARGMLLRASDEEWLVDYADEVLAVLYWMVDQSPLSVPAECFSYHGFQVNTGTGEPADQVRFVFKHGLSIENVGSLRILPPLQTRGFVGPHRLRTTERAAQALLRLLADDPLDRRVVAVRQYFRTHFSDPFLGSRASDIAAHCAAIEAALGIDARQDGQAKFVNALVEHYGDLPNRREFFCGMYIARSFYVHGHPADAADELPPQTAEAYRFFMATAWTGKILKAITRDCIHLGLGTPAIDAPVLVLEASQLLSIALGSDGVWSAARDSLLQSGAADAIQEMDDQAFARMHHLVFDLENLFAWTCVRTPPSIKRVCRAICTCVLLIVRSPAASAEVRAEAAALGNAADAEDAAALHIWFHTHETGWRYEIEAGPTSRLGVYQRMAYCLAARFAVSPAA